MTIRGAKRRANSLPATILLTGFAPFGGEVSNPSWEVAAQLDGHEFGRVVVVARRLPVNCARASRMLNEAIERLRPAAVVGLGQAGGRPALSLEQVAVNLADLRPRRETLGGLRAQPIVPGGPDAYLARLPLARILTALRTRGIPAAVSMTAGVYVCNAVMYTALHALRRRSRVPAGFIHLPYEAAQATGHRETASMSLALMLEGIRTALSVVAREAVKSPHRVRQI